MRITKKNVEAFNKLFWFKIGHIFSALMSFFIAGMILYSVFNIPLTNGFDMIGRMLFFVIGAIFVPLGFILLFRPLDFGLKFWGLE